MGSSQAASSGRLTYGEIAAKYGECSENELMAMRMEEFSGFDEQALYDKLDHLDSLCKRISEGRGPLEKRKKAVFAEIKLKGMKNAGAKFLSNSVRAGEESNEQLVAAVDKSFQPTQPGHHPALKGIQPFRAPNTFLRSSNGTCGRRPSSIAPKGSNGGTFGDALRKINTERETCCECKQDTQIQALRKKGERLLCRPCWEMNIKDIPWRLDDDDNVGSLPWAEYDKKKAVNGSTPRPDAAAPNHPYASREAPAFTPPIMKGRAHPSAASGSASMAFKTYLPRAHATRGALAKQSQVTGKSKEHAIEIGDSDNEDGTDRQPALARTRVSTRSTRHEGLREQYQGLRAVYPHTGGKGAVEVLPEDLSRLEPLEFLNDTCIDFYMKLLQDKGAASGAKFYIFNSFFYKKLVEGAADTAAGRSKDRASAYERVKSWTKDVDIFAFDYVVIPIHDALHWSVAVVCHPGAVPDSPPDGGDDDDDDVVEDPRQYDMFAKEDPAPRPPKRPLVLHLDSMTGGHSSLSVYPNVIGYLNHEWKRKEQEPDTVAFKWRQRNPGIDFTFNKETTQTSPLTLDVQRAQVPQQQNHCDCGLFVLAYTEFLMAWAPKPPAGITKEALQNARVAIPGGVSPTLLRRNWFTAENVNMLRDHLLREMIKLMLEQATGTAPEKSLKQASDYLENTENIPFEYGKRYLTPEHYLRYLDGHPELLTPLVPQPRNPRKVNRKVKKRRSAARVSDVAVVDDDPIENSDPGEGADEQEEEEEEEGEEEEEVHEVMVLDVGPTPGPSCHEGAAALGAPGPSGVAEDADLEETATPWQISAEQRGITPSTGQGSSGAHCGVTEQHVSPKRSRESAGRDGAASPGGLSPSPLVAAKRQRTQIIDDAADSNLEEPCEDMQAANLSSRLSNVKLAARQTPHPHASGRAAYGPAAALFQESSPKSTSRGDGAGQGSQGHHRREVERVVDAYYHQADHGDDGDGNREEDLVDGGQERSSGSDEGDENFDPPEGELEVMPPGVSRNVHSQAGLDVDGAMPAQPPDAGPCHGAGTGAAGGSGGTGSTGTGTGGAGSGCTGAGRAGAIGAGTSSDAGAAPATHSHQHAGPHSHRAGGHRGNPHDHHYEAQGWCSGRGEAGTSGQPWHEGKAGIPQIVLMDRNFLSEGQGGVPAPAEAQPPVQHNARRKGSRQREKPKEYWRGGAQTAQTHTQETEGVVVDEQGGSTTAAEQRAEHRAEGAVVVDETQPEEPEEPEQYCNLYGPARPRSVPPPRRPTPPPSPADSNDGELHLHIDSDGEDAGPSPLKSPGDDANHWEEGGDRSDDSELGENEPEKVLQAAMLRPISRSEAYSRLGIPPPVQWEPHGQVTGGADESGRGHVPDDDYGACGTHMAPGGHMVPEGRLAVTPPQVLQHGGQDHGKRAASDEHRADSDVIDLASGPTPLPLGPLPFQSPVAVAGAAAESISPEVVPLDGRVQQEGRSRPAGQRATAAAPVGVKSPPRRRAPYWNSRDPRLKADLRPEDKGHVAGTSRAKSPVDEPKQGFLEGFKNVQQAVRQSAEALKRNTLVDDVVQPLHVDNMFAKPGRPTRQPPHSDAGHGGAPGNSCSRSPCRRRGSSKGDVVEVTSDSFEERGSNRRGSGGRGQRAAAGEVERDAQIARELHEEWNGPHQDIRKALRRSERQGNRGEGVARDSSRSVDSDGSSKGRSHSRSAHKRRRNGKKSKGKRGDDCHEGEGSGWHHLQRNGTPGKHGHGHGTPDKNCRRHDTPDKHGVRHGDGHGYRHGSPSIGKKGRGGKRHKKHHPPSHERAKDQRCITELFPPPVSIDLAEA